MCNHTRSILLVACLVVLFCSLPEFSAGSIYMDEDFEGETPFVNRDFPVRDPGMDPAEAIVAVQGINLRGYESIYSSSSLVTPLVEMDYDLGNRPFTIVSDRSFAGSQSLKLTSGRTLGIVPGQFPTRDLPRRFWQFAISTDADSVAQPAGTPIGHFRIDYSTDSTTDLTPDVSVGLDLVVGVTGGADLVCANNGRVLKNLSGASHDWAMVSIAATAFESTEWYCYDALTKTFKGPQPIVKDPEIDDSSNYYQMPEGVHIFVNSNAITTETVYLSPEDLGNGWGVSDPDRFDYASEIGWEFSAETGGSIYLDNLYWDSVSRSRGGDSAESAARMTNFEASGGVRVVIEPEDAALHGGQWRLTTGPNTQWHKSGEVLRSAPPGAYTVEFRETEYGIAPPSQEVSLSMGHEVQITGTYTWYYGALHVTITPSEVLDEGAQWRLTTGPDTEWHDTNTALTVVPAGLHAIEFRDLPDWIEPTPTIEVLRDQTTRVTEEYIPAARIQVTITPQAALDDGAAWSVDDGATWNDSGATVKVTPGDHTVVFRDLPGWVTPADDFFTLAHRQEESITVFQNGIPGTPDVSINPAEPRTLDTVEAVVSSIDPDGEVISEYHYEWLLNDTVVTTEPFLPSRHTAKHQSWVLLVRARDSRGIWGNWGGTSFTIANTVPTQPVVEIRPRVPSPDSDLVVNILGYSTDADGDEVAYDFDWFQSKNNGATWINKTELAGSSQVSNLYIDEGDVWRVHFVPYEKASAPLTRSVALQDIPRVASGRIEGIFTWDQVYVGDNSLPELTFTRLASRWNTQNVLDLTIEWAWSDADGDACEVSLWYTHKNLLAAQPLRDWTAADENTFSGSAAIPSGVRPYAYAVIRDAKGGITHVTEQMQLPETAAGDHWMLLE